VVPGEAPEAGHTERVGDIGAGLPGAYAGFGEKRIGENTEISQTIVVALQEIVAADLGPDQRAQSVERGPLGRRVKE
jgi:hypothetical protein